MGSHLLKAERMKTNKAPKNKAQKQNYAGFSRLSGESGVFICASIEKLNNF